MTDQLAFPWQHEGNAKRRKVLLDWFDFLSAYAAVTKRFNRRMAELRLADAPQPSSED